MESITVRSARALNARNLAWVRSTPARLAGLGLVSVLLYALGLAVRYPIQASFQIPRATWTSQVAAAGPALVIHLAVYVGVTLAYVFACKLVWRQGSTRAVDLAAGDLRREPGGRAIVPVIVVGWLLSSAVLLGVAPGGESHDVFDYTFRGRMWVELGGNPLADIPRVFEGAILQIYRLA